MTPVEKNDQAGNPERKRSYLFGPAYAKGAYNDWVRPWPWAQKDMVTEMVSLVVALFDFLIFLLLVPVLPPLPPFIILLAIAIPAMVAGRVVAYHRFGGK